MVQNESNETEELIPVFVPPLANLLAHGEKTKGTRLSEGEVIRVRDHSTCIMMTTTDAAKMEESRGFRDVEPENCWADWHRLRVEFTGNGFLPRLILCVLGNADLESRSNDLLRDEEIETDWRESDGAMSTAFRSCESPWNRSLTDQDRESIASHRRVVYLLSPHLTAANGPRACLRSLKLIQGLFEIGALAVKCESSGITHGRDRWNELATQVDGDDPWMALLNAFVQFPISSGVEYYSCGLHLLGTQDLIVSVQLLQEAVGHDGDVSGTVLQLFREFAHYLLAECATGKFGSGHTFSLDAQSPRYRMIWEECTGYDEDDFYFNPFGRWRFAEIV